MNLKFIQALAASGVPVTAETRMEEVVDRIKFPEILPPTGNPQLYSHQIEHSYRLLRALSRGNKAGDTSPPGLGKTHVICWVARQMGLPLVIHCPKSVCKTWYDTARLWGVPIVTATNYDMARSSHSETNGKWKDMRSGYTEKATICPWVRKRKVLKKKEPVYQFDYKPPYKVLFGVDEGHVGKNSETQCFSLIEGIMRASKRYGHKAIYISATPIEKKSNPKALLYFLDYISKPDMRLMNEFFKDKVGSLDIKDIHSYLYDITKSCISTMENKSDTTDEFINDVKAVSVKMGENATKRIKECSINMAASQERLKNKQISGSLGSLMRERTLLENAKIEYFRDKSIRILRPGKKWKRLAIFLNFKESLKMLYDYLSNYFSRDKICTLYGDNSEPDNQISIANFNSGKCPIIIATLSKSCIGVSLHDTIGGQHTHVLISPSCSATVSRQIVARCFRTGTKSDVKQRIIFAEGDEGEVTARANVATKLKDATMFTSGQLPGFEL